jgi:hypothetical protein
MLKLALASALSLAFMAHAFAFDNGKYDNADPKIRQWFKSVRSPTGIPCCDIADGRRTMWRATSVVGTLQIEFEVLVDGEWLPVPPEAVVRGTTNPTGDSIVWLRQDKVVRCFVLAPEG